MSFGVMMDIYNLQLLMSSIPMQQHLYNRGYIERVNHMQLLHHCLFVVAIDLLCDSFPPDCYITVV